MGARSFASRSYFLFCSSSTSGFGVRAASFNEFLSASEVCLTKLRQWVKKYLRTNCPSFSPLSQFAIWLIVSTRHLFSQIPNIPASLFTAPYHPGTSFQNSLSSCASLFTSPTLCIGQYTRRRSITFEFEFHGSTSQ